jgi:aspartate racemase
MKTAGMIGGLGPESTAIYYREIVAAYRKATTDASYPSLFINSVDMKKVLELVTDVRYADLAAFLSGELRKLAAAGAEFGFITANTPHIVFDEIQERAPLPLISIVQVACAEAKKLGCTRVGLLGARFTMQASFYPKVFAAQQIAVVTPGAAEQDYIHQKYMGELVDGLIVPDTRTEFLRIMTRLRENQNVDGVILGGTELSLLFHENTVCGIPLLDSTKIHVRAVVERMLE